MLGTKVSPWRRQQILLESSSSSVYSNCHFGLFWQLQAQLGLSTCSWHEVKVFSSPAKQRIQYQLLNVFNIQIKKQKAKIHSQD